MENKITLSLVSLGLGAVLIAIALTGVIFHRSFENQMEKNAAYIAENVAANYDSAVGAESVDEYGGEIRITLLDDALSVIYDSNGEDSAQNCTELSSAAKNGTGEAVRYSRKLDKDIYYYALTLDDGNILRVGVPARTVVQAFSESALAIISIIVIVMFFAVAMALVLTRRLVKPINDLASQLDDPTLPEDESRVYRELSPFVREIQTQRREQENMRQEFTANVSHELKTPLTTISGYAELIENDMVKAEDTRRFGEIIHKEAGRMLLLISDIIRLSELDSTADTEGEKNPVDLLKLAEECVGVLEESAARRSIALEIRGHSCVVSGEANQLWEMIYNLIDNAIRYNKDGGRVVIQLGDKSISVADNGIGIPREHQNRIFERFYRVDKSHSRETGGTGLGLSIVKHVAELHHGQISVDSKVGSGTKITVNFGCEDSRNSNKM